ncbi:MAG TPA: exopolysaccharide biosynthesis polyprenyl glycosylphosphotransferase [Terracidiphilus sp.]|nr:exopolysaccharide biosynthesis polyprenyl glycosylphosphotransferase [Terracidiphilus sp.]
MAAPDFVASNFYSETIAELRNERQTVSRAMFKNTLALVEVSADFVTCSIGIFAANYFCTFLPFTTHPLHPLRLVASLGIVFALLSVFLQYRDGAYSRDGGLLQIRETERAIRIPAQSLTLLLIISLLLNRNLSSLVFLIAIFLVPALLILQKQILFMVVRGLQQRVDGVERVVIYGTGDTSRSVVSTLLHSPRLGFLPVAVVEDNPAQSSGCIPAMGYRHRRSVPVQSGPLTPALLKSLRVDLLLLATPNLSSEQIISATHAANQVGSGIAMLSGPAVQENLGTESLEIDGLLFTALKEPPRPWLYAIAKRIADLVLSSILLALLTPFLAVIAMLIRLDSPGPALFIQKRVGRNGALFNMYKFRSMYTRAPKYDLSPTISNDPRITRIGRILRRASLDELPQLINVLRGNMSLVGPRPEMPFIVERYDAQQRQRLQVIPGITGLWQLSADRSFPIHQNIQYDLYYIRNRNFAMDLAILIHTLFFALHGGI